MGITLYIGTLKVKVALNENLNVMKIKTVNATRLYAIVPHVVHSHLAVSRWAPSLQLSRQPGFDPSIATLYYVIPDHLLL